MSRKSPWNILTSPAFSAASLSRARPSIGRLRSTRSQFRPGRSRSMEMVLFPAPEPMSRMFSAPGFRPAAVREMRSSMMGASMTACWPVSRFENLSTSASNRAFISSTVDFFVCGVFTP